MKSQNGFTLVELVMAIVVISIAVAGLFGAMSAIQARSADPLITAQAAAIAEAYLEEVSSRPFTDPSVDPDTGAACAGPASTRGSHDNICDYNGLTDPGARDQYGNAISGLGNYNVSVTVTPNYAWQGLSAADVVRIDVTVSNTALARSFMITGIRTRY